MAEHQPGECIIFDTSAMIVGVSNIQTSKILGTWQWDCLFEVWNGYDAKVTVTSKNVVTTQIFGDCQEYVSSDAKKRHEIQEKVYGQSYEFRFKVTKCLWDKFNYECVDAFCLEFINELEVD